MLTSREPGGTQANHGVNFRRRSTSAVKPFVAGATGFALGAGLLSVAVTGIPAQSLQTEPATDGTSAVVAGHSGVAVPAGVRPGEESYRGTDGDDVLTGTEESDSILAGEGSDIVSALAGDDVLTGDDGDDAIDAGAGMDMIFGGEGNDFTDGGPGGNEHILGGGNDLTIAGEGANTVFAGAGDDWIEGGNANDLLAGDGGSPYEDAPDGAGDDVLIGNGGQDDFHAGGGNDVMLAGEGTKRNDGAGGFDWSTHSRGSGPAEADLRMLFEEDSQPDSQHKYLSVEALSGGKHDDILRGDDRVPATEPGNSLDAAAVTRIAGLAGLLPEGATTWGAGNIILGGTGSDTIEGLGGDDIIDGNAALHVRLSVRTDPADAATEIASAASLAELQQDIMAGTISPANIVAVRELRTEPDPTAVDTAVFSGPQAEYDVTTTDGVTTVAHARGSGADGTDTLTGIESLRFSDRTVELVAPAQPADEVTIERIAGPTKYDTSAAISAAFYESDVPVVYIARGDHFADALTAGPAAHADGGPLLLVEPSKIPAAIAAELQRLEPQRIVVTGGHLAVKDRVLEELRGFTDGPVTRVAGPTAAGTAAAISRSSQDEGVDRVYIPTSAKFPDAMAGAAPAARDGHPVLLVTAGKIPADTETELARLKPAEIVVLGGHLAVKDETVRQLEETAPVTRIGGATLYETAAMISKEFYDPGVPRVFVATGRNFPDALSAGPVAALADGPILLVPTDGPIPEAVKAELERLDTSVLSILGGHLAVSPGVQSQLETLLQPGL